MRAAAVALVLAVAGCTSVMTSQQPAVLFADGEGLQPSGTSQRIDFGRAEQGVVVAVSRVIGSNPAEISTNAECGAGPVRQVRWANGLTLNFQRGTFLGWVSREGRGAVIASSTGIAPGASQETAAARPGTRFTQTSLGTEFSVGGTSGLVEEGEVVAIWAGLTCFFR